MVYKLENLTDSACEKIKKQIKTGGAGRNIIMIPRNVGPNRGSDTREGV